MAVRYGYAIELWSPVEGGLDLVKLPEFASVRLDFNRNLPSVRRYGEDVEPSSVGLQFDSCHTAPFGEELSLYTDRFVAVFPSKMQSS